MTDRIATARAGRRLADRRYQAMWAAMEAYAHGAVGACPFDRPGEEDLRAGWERGLELAALLERMKMRGPMTHAARVAAAMEREDAA